MGRLGACVRLHGLAFGRSLAPALLGVGLVMAIVLGGHGVPPREIARLLRASTIGRLAVAMGWAWVTRSGAHAVVLPPGAAWLRSGPTSRAAQIAIAACFVLAAQSPILGVLLAGHDPLAAVAVGAAAATLACVPLDARGVVLGVLSLVALVVAPMTSPLVFAAAIHHAWREAPIRRRVRAVRLRALPASAQLVLAHVRALVRERPFAAIRSLIAVTLGVALVARRRGAGQDSWDRASLLQIGVIVTVVTAAPLLAPIGRVRRALRRVVRASATPRIVALLAAVLVVTFPALAFAAGVGGVRLAAEGASTPIVDAIAIALFCSAIGLLLVRLEERVHARRRDAPFVLVMLVAALGVGFAVIAMLPRAFLAIVVVSLSTWGLLVREPEVPLADDA